MCIMTESKGGQCYVGIIWWSVQRNSVVSKKCIQYLGGVMVK